MYLFVLYRTSSYDPDFLIISANKSLQQQFSICLSGAKPDIFYLISAGGGISFAFCAISDPAEVEYSDICLDSNPWLLIKQDIWARTSLKQNVMKPQGMNLEQSQYAVVTAFSSPSLLTHAQKCREKKPDAIDRLFSILGGTWGRRGEISAALDKSLMAS